MHQSRVIERSLKSLTAFIQKQVSEEERYTHWNPRQQALLFHAETHPQTVYTIEEHRGSHAIAYDTARKDLLELYKTGLLTMHKRGKAFVFKKAKPL